MRNSFTRAVGTTGFALAALASAIIMAPGCGDQASDPLASETGLSDADAILAAPGLVDDVDGDGEVGDERVTREVTLTENGVIITIDSDDPECIEEIQERAAHHAARPRPDDAPPVEVIIENTATGVIITLSGATEEAVALIQERATQERGERRERRGGREGGPGRPGGGERLEGVERTVTETATGLEISLTSDNAETVEALQSRNNGEAPERPEGARDDITVTVVDTENGVLITMTGETEEAIEFLHSRDEQERPREGGRRGGRRPRQR